MFYIFRDQIPKDKSLKIEEGDIHKKEKYELKFIFVVQHFS